MSFLIIAEKPSVARQIASALVSDAQNIDPSQSALMRSAKRSYSGGQRVLAGGLDGRQAVVTSARGHLVDISSPQNRTTTSAPAPSPGGATRSVVRQESFRWLLVPHFSMFPLQPREESGAKTQLNMLVALLRAAAASREPVEIVNACDAGREGELIFYLVFSYALKDQRENLPVHVKHSRLWLQGMRPQDIKQAWKERQPASRYEGLLASARCRRAADWMAGINASSTLGAGAHVGRVQTPTLAFIVERQRQIDNFKPVAYKRIVGKFAPQGDDEEIQAIWAVPKKDDEDGGAQAANQSGGDAQKLPRSAITDVAVYERLMDKLKAKQGSLVLFLTAGKGRQQWAAPLFNLASLQRAANKQMGITAAQTLEIAQALYEKGVISYPRTESTALPDGYSGQIAQWMQQLRDGGAPALAKLAAKALDSGWVHEGVTLGAKKEKLFDTSKVSDHYAIVPLRPAPSSDASEQEKKLFDLIARQTLAVFFPVSWIAEQRMTFDVDGEMFETAAKRIAVAGWQECFGKSGFADGQAESFDPKSLEEQSEGQAKFVSVRGEDKKTTPPTPYTDADLIAKMERAGTPVAEITDDDDGRLFGASFTGTGIGTAATRAAIIERLIKAKKPYALRKGKSILPNEEGMKLIALLEKAKGAGRALCDAEMTSAMERRLYQVSLGRLAEDEFMQDFCEQTKAIVMDLEPLGTRGAPVEAVASLAGLCPNCHGDVGLSSERIRCVYGCGFSLFRKAAGHELTEDEIAALLRDGQTPFIKNFVAKSGKAFEAALKLLAPDPKHKEERRRKWWATEYLFQNSKPEPHPGLEGQCPVCQSDVGMNERRVECTNEKCTFGLWRQIAGHALTVDEVQALLRDRVTNKILGFVSSKTNKKFDAVLILEEKDGVWQVGFKFDRPEGEGGAASGEEFSPALSCFKDGCDGHLQKMGGAHPRCVCNKCKATIWRTVCGVVLTEQVIRELVEQGETSASVNGFKGKKGAFSAFLSLDKASGRTNFVFR